MYEDQHQKAAVKLIGSRVGNGLLGNLSIHGIDIPTPSFIFELAGPEDFETMIRFHHILKEPHAISIPAYHWGGLSQTTVPSVDDDYHLLALNFISNNHIITYEPPEYYRYTMPTKLLSHALRSDRGKARKFYKLAMVDDDKENALNMLPQFERAFINKQWDSLRWKKSIR